MSGRLQVSRMAGCCPYCLSSQISDVTVNRQLYCENGHEWYYEYVHSLKKLWLRNNPPLFNDWVVINNN